MFSHQNIEDIFNSLSPTVKKLFQSASEVTMQRLITAAGIGESKGINQAALIRSLRENGITASVTDISKIQRLEQIMQPSATHSHTHEMKKS